MKKKVYLISFLLLLLIGFITFTVYNKPKVQTQNSEESKPKSQALDKAAIERSLKKASERNIEAFSIDLKSAGAEKIYETFNGPNADEIITLLEMDRDDSDRILVSPDGTILSGQATIDENGTKVDSNTDKNSITVKELKDLVLEHKEKIDELAAQNNPLE
ncbi:hypothetical protein ATZ33_00845 [Enterococcus silesiacus]|uniref:Uncharacterized protein n=1 Tax=Enterococcus silesiacus TaxID=332949 RepID=A0A0S3K6R8_9ENTE|nr:hypothetical protein [Enterococcus silesiacus]ALR99978.1 hypothetical protein ATZ33_00845 [Enterococcus silesiacus]OJG92710.1 hypothetical protein RV15_GL002655 [Enterococcus silesiacus]